MASESNPEFDLQKRYQILFNSRIMGIIVSNFAGDILEANDRFLELLGYTRADLNSKKLNWHKMTPPEYLELSINIQNKLVKTGDYVSFEKAYYHRDGHLVHVRVGSTFLQEETVITLVEDVSTREKRGEELVRAQTAKELAEAQARQAQFISDLTFEISHTFDLKEMFTVFTEGMVPDFCDLCTVELIDEEGMDYGLAVVRGLNRAEEEYVRRWHVRNPPKWDSESGAPLLIKDRKTIVINDIKHMKRLVDENFSWETIDFAGERAEIFSEAFMVVPLLTREQKALGYVTFISTRSRRKLSPADQALAEEITQRLAVLIENSRLYFQSQDASRAKSDFLANVSHEIRTPLGAMLGFTEILRDDLNLSTDQKQTVDTILRNGQQLLKIVNEILDISKVESEKIQIEQLRFNLPDLVSDVVHLMRVQAEDKGIELQLVMNDVPEYVVSDPGRLRQILINIVGNAIKFTEVGMVEMTVFGTPLGTKTQLQFVIKDTGIGISKESRGNLFQAFTQADSSTTRRYGGTGLGLFLSRKLARLLGGDISFTSTEGQGSEFTVTVVASLPVNQAAENVPEAGDSDQLRAPGNLNERVLIVDDASDNRELFKRYLLKAGLREEQIGMADNGEEALEKACDGCFRLILMDIQMPKMDGLQAIRVMRGRGYKGWVVALTAHAMKGDREKCLEAGFDGYLQKPLKREELREILNQRFFLK